MHGIWSRRNTEDAVGPEVEGMGAASPWSSEYVWDRELGLMS